MYNNFPSSKLILSLLLVFSEFCVWVWCLFVQWIFFFQALFAQSLFLSWRGQFQELQLKSDLFDSDQNWTVARLNDFQKEAVGELDNSKTFFTESHFRAVAPYFF